MPPTQTRLHDAKAVQRIVLRVPRWLEPNIRLAAFARPPIEGTSSNRGGACA